MRNLNAQKIMQVSQILDFKLSSEGVNNLVNLTRVSASNDDIIHIHQQDDNKNIERFNK